MLWFLLGGGLGVLLCVVPISAENPGQSPPNLRRAAIKPICMTPVGVVKKQGKRAWLEIEPEYAPALAGLQGFSHLWVIYWFHENDTPRGAPDPPGPPPAGPGQSFDRRLRLPGPGAAQPHRFHRLPHHQGKGQCR